MGVYISLCVCGLLLITCSGVNVCKEHNLLYLGTSVVFLGFFSYFLKGFCEIHCLCRSQACSNVSCLSLTSSELPVSGAAAAEFCDCSFCSQSCKEPQLSNSPTDVFVVVTIAA